MRLLIALVAVAMLTIAIGCAPDETASTTTTPAATPATSTQPANAAVTPDTSNLQTVSLKLPGMT